MIDVNAAFSARYAQARVKFLEGAATAGMAIRSYEHPLKGRDGETLAMDVALDGPADAQSLLIVSSACHGVEGYCGSGVQVFATHDAEWRAKARDAGVAVLYIHALNPHGFSHVRRVTNENVDLNRNFQDFSQPLPVNPAYAEIHQLLLPAQWPPTAENEAAIAAYIAQNGLAKFQAAVSQGQHPFADGQFFGRPPPRYAGVGKLGLSARFSPSFPAAWIMSTPFESAYFTASSTAAFSGEKPLPKLMLMTCAPLSTAYRIALATSLSRSSPSGTVRIIISFTLGAIPSTPPGVPRTPAMMPATCVPCFASGPITSAFPYLRSFTFE